MQVRAHVQVARRGKIDIVNSDPILHNTHGYYGKRTAFNVALPIQDGKSPSSSGLPAKSGSIATPTAGCSPGSTQGNRI